MTKTHSTFLMNATLLQHQWLEKVIYHKYASGMQRPVILRGWQVSIWLVAKVISQLSLYSNSCSCTMVKHYIPWYQGSWGQHGADLGPTGPRWAPYGPHELCYLGPLVQNIDFLTKWCKNIHIYKRSGCSLNIKMLSYLYRDTHVKVSRPSYLQHGNPIHGKTAFILKWAWWLFLSLHWKSPYLERQSWYWKPVDSTYLSLYQDVLVLQTIVFFLTLNWIV